MKNKGLKVAVAIMLIITLTMADFILVGTNLVTYALEDIENSTNNENVKFAVYFEEEETPVSETRYQIDNSEMKLYMEVSAEKGTFDGVVTLEDTNFRFKKEQPSESIEQVSENRIDLKQVMAGKSLKIQVEIEPIIDENYAQEMLNKKSQLKITGDYKYSVNGNEKVKTIDTTKEVTLKLLPPSNANLTLDGKVITNKVYDIQGVNKKLVQIDLNSAVEGNPYPIETTTLEVQLPQGAEAIEVISKGTYATDGEGDRKLEENSDYAWDKTQNVLTVKIENTSKDGKISWKKDSIDNIIVTMTLPEGVTLGTEEYSLKSIVKFCGEENSLSKDSKYSIANEVNGIITTSIENTEEIYKGKIYSQENREYKTTTNVEINYANLVENVILKEKTVYKTETEAKNANIQYKSTTILKSDFDKVLGESGTLIIKDQNGNLVKEIKATDFESSENTIITYAEGVKELAIELSTAIATGIVRLNHIKVIQAEANYTREEIKELKCIVEQAKVLEFNFEKATELKETTTEVGLTVSNTTISSENKQVEMAITLKSNNEKYQLFKNPQFKITLPDGVTINSVGEAKISATNEKTLSISNIQNKTKEILVKITGEQEKYVTSEINPQITFNVNVNVEKLMANKTATIKMQYTNQYNNDSAIYELESTPINIIASNSKVVTNLKVENYDGLGATIERYSDSTGVVKGKLPIGNTSVIEVPVTYTVINNYNSTLIANVMTLDINFVENEATPRDLKNATEANIEIPAGEMKEIKQLVQVPANLYYNNNVEITSLLEYSCLGISDKVYNNISLETESKEVPRNSSVIDDKIRLETYARLGDGTEVKESTEVYNEQVVEYIIKVTNISNEVISNVEIINKQENGKIYDLKTVIVKDKLNNTFEQHEYDELDTDTKIFEKIATLNPEEERQLICRVVAKKSAQSNITSANISISADGIEKQSLTKISNVVKDVELKVSIRNSEKDEIQLYGNDELYLLTDLKNLTNEKMENIKIRKYFTNGMTYNNFFIEAIDVNENPLDIVKEISYNEEEQYVEFYISTLEANQEIMINSSLHIDSLLLEQMISSEKVYIVANRVSSNSVDVNVKQRETKISIIQTTNIEADQKVKENETVVITGKISNIGYTDAIITIEDNLPNGLEAKKVEIIRGDETVDKTQDVGEQFVSVSSEINQGETIFIKIEATVNTSRIVTEEIKNKITVVPEFGEHASSNEIIIQVYSRINNDTESEEPDTEEPGFGAPEVEVPDNEEPEIEGPVDEEENPDDGELDDDNKPDEDKPDNNKPDDEKPGDDNNKPEENPGDGDDNDKPDEENPNVEKKTYTISGYAWVDINENQHRDEKEQIENIIVKIIDLNNKNTFLKDKSGNEIEVKTDKNGKYEIADIPKGNYNVIFKYDTNVYELKESLEIKDYIIEKTNEKVAITSNIKLESDTTINLQLIELTEFNLKIDKYISKVIVNTVNGTKTTEYRNKKLVKEEISSKYLAGATVLVEYTLEISNIGELAGHATEIVDYLPTGMKFHSELNTQWYIGEDGNIYNTSLSNALIQPGESKIIKLVLLKTMTKENTGTTLNIAEISETLNMKEYTDIDINDNKSKAEIIVNPATGTIITYLLAILSSIAIVVVGVYWVKKRVVGKEQI